MATQDRPTRSVMDAAPAPGWSALRLLYAAAGSLFLVVGIVGLVMPLLPGTVFLLLAAAAFARSVPAWHRRLTQHRWLGPPIARWEQERCLNVRTKWLASLMLVPPALSTLYVLRDSPVWATVFGLVFLGIAAYVQTRATCAVRWVPIKDEKSRRAPRR
jgi:uncharacterized membrane protein YbaN (DUF454 family)